MGKPARFRSRNLLTITIAVAGCIAGQGGPFLVWGQEASAAKQAPAYNKVIGAVLSVATDGKKLTVKPDTGESTDVILDERTSYMLVPPGEKDLRKATRMELKDITPGDHVYARIRKVEGQDQSPAVSVMVMSKTDIAQHQEKNRQEWQARGAAGKVKAVDPAAKTIAISVQTAVGLKEMTVRTDDKTNFRRYAPDSVKFSEAKPSNFGAIAVNNNLRVLGDKNEDGTSIHAEELVSGSFRNLAGTVISIDAANNEIKLNDLLTKKPVTIKVDADANLRRIPEQMATRMARARANGAANPGGTAQGQPKGQGGPGSHPGFNGPATARADGMSSAGGGAPAGNRPAWGGGANGAGMGRMDMNQVLEQVPRMALTDLKAGDALIVSCTNGSDPSRVMAIAIVGGVEPILAAAPPSSAQSAMGGGMWNLDIGLPQ